MVNPWLRGQHTHIEKWEVFLCLGDSRLGGLQWSPPSSAMLTMYFHARGKLLYFGKEKVRMLLLDLWDK